MKSIAFGQYYPTESVIHRLDPRAKIIMTILYIVCTFLCKNLLSFVLLVLSAILLAIISRIPLRLILRALRPILMIIAFTAVLNIFFTKGEQLLTPASWWLRIYAEGLWNALFMILRITTLILGTSIFLTYTTTPIALTDAIESLLSPLKKLHVPVHDFAMMMTITLRFIPTLTEETERIMSAQKARGADFTSGSLIKRARALIPILVPLLVSAINRAIELASAMECRCYHGGEGRTKLKKLHFRPTDALAMLGIVAFGAAILLLNHLGFGYTM